LRTKRRIKTLISVKVLSAKGSNVSIFGSKDQRSPLVLRLELGRSRWMAAQSVGTGCGISV